MSDLLECANPGPECADGHIARTDEPQQWDAELLVLQHPDLARVRFSCSCVGCHHQILTARFGRALADAWFLVRDDLRDPADVQH